MRKAFKPGVSEYCQQHCFPRHSTIPCVFGAQEGTHRGCDWAMVLWKQGFVRTRRNKSNLNAVICRGVRARKDENAACQYDKTPCSNRKKLSRAWTQGVNLRNVTPSYGSHTQRPCTRWVHSYRMSRQGKIYRESGCQCLGWERGLIASEQEGIF